MSKAYLVCATPRSGSTLLCEALKATGVAGRPEEYFESVVATGRPPRPESYLDGLDDLGALALLGGAAAPEPPPYSSLEGVARYAEHLERVREWGTTRNGVFGVKLMWDHVGRLHRRAGDPLELFGDPDFVWVRRRDVVRQAVSFWRAMQTQAWRDEGAAGGAHEPQYSFAALRHLVGRLSEHDRCWGELLAGRRVLELAYEDVTADLPGAVRRTLDHLGVAPPEQDPELPTMRRQADELSDAWAAAYARDLQPAPAS
jgi:LPS sulfotransferase NodH